MMRSIPYTAPYTQIMTAINPLAASSADENVLVVVGHANDFMGQDLSD